MASRPTASTKTRIQSALGITHGKFSMMRSMELTAKSKASLLKLKCADYYYYYSLLKCLKTCSDMEDKQSLMTRCEWYKTATANRCLRKAMNEN